MPQEHTIGQHGSRTAIPCTQANLNALLTSEPPRCSRNCVIGVAEGHDHGQRGPCPPYGRACAFSGHAQELFLRRARHSRPVQKSSTGHDQTTCPAAMHADHTRAARWAVRAAAIDSACPDEGCHRRSTGSLAVLADSKQWGTAWEQCSHAVLLALLSHACETDYSMVRMGFGLKVTALDQ